MTHIDRTEQQRAMRDEMSRKANQLLTQMLNTDQNGNPRRTAPARPVTPAHERPAAERIAEIDRLDPSGENAELSALRERLTSTLPAGAGDGGARAPLPAPSLQEQADAALAAGDTRTAMSIKSQMTAENIRRQNEGQ